MMSAGEKAMALVDGQLAPVEVPGLVRELARNAALVAELQGYLAMSRSRIARVYAAKTDEQVPRRLVDAIMEAPLATGTSRSAGQASPLGERLIGWLRGRRRVPAWSLAAAPTLAAAAAFALAVAVMPAGRDGSASSELGTTLERTASGTEAALATVRPMLSFSSKDGRWCRQYEMRGARRQTSHGLACRGQGGNWRVIASTVPSGASGYAPAGTDRRRTIDDLVTSMIVGEPLAADGEAAVISKGWQL
jgi:hypothetical protein